jgi:Zn-finger protein
MNIFARNGKRVLEPYVGTSPIPAPPKLDLVDIDGTAHDSELPPHAQWPHSTSRPSKSAVAYVTVSSKAKRRKMCGFFPCCRREDVTLSCTYNRPMMILAVGLVASFRTIFDSFRWNSIRICQTCYVVSSGAMAKARSEFSDIRQLDAEVLAGPRARSVQYSTCIRHAQSTLLSNPLSST